jgi:metallo-beta-lactamase class B
MKLWAAVLAFLVPQWNQPFPPHKVAENLYYVGTNFLASYLITTPQGHILVNPNYEESVPLIQASVEKLGFHFRDVKIVLISHAHDDHCAGLARVKQLTGAKVMVMDQDAETVEKGGNWKRPVKVDRELKDGDEVKLGGAALIAHLTPGHTPGCTTWTMRAENKDVVIVGSPNVNPGYILVNNKEYPGIAYDYERTFRVLKALPCDIFLGAHGSYYDLERKYAKLKTGGANPFIDPAGYRAYIAEREQAFQRELRKQQTK